MMRSEFLKKIYVLPRRFIVLLAIAIGVVFFVALILDSLAGSVQDSVNEISPILQSHVLKPKVNHTEEKRPYCKATRTPPLVKYTGSVDERVTIPFDDRPYQGPVVEGWAPNVSRQVKIYTRPTENTILIEPSNLGGDPRWCVSTKLFIFQHSRPSNFAIRLDNRRTWMNYIKEYLHIRAVFVVGRPSGAKSELIQAKIEEEAHRYGDVLQVDYLEHANNNTLKTILALKYIFSVDWMGNYPEFVMKSDDDVYINLPLLSNFIFDKPEYRSESIEKSTRKRWPPLFGFLFITSPVLQVQPEKKLAKFTDYLICPSYMYNKTSYPTFTSGTGYIMPWWSLPCFYQESMNLPYFFIEDVYMGGFVADRCLIPKKALPGFSPGRKDVADVKHDVDLLIHYMNHDHKFEMHRKITGGHNAALQVKK